MQTIPLGQSTLLDELELRQNEVLQQLDELNVRLETLLRSLREFDQPSVAPSN
jgi:hypothetical protein